MEQKKVKQFEIYLYDHKQASGSVQSGKRPVIVIQDNRFNSSGTTTIVAAITGRIKKEYLPSHVYIGQDYGLDIPSMVMLEQLYTVNQEDLVKFIGLVADERICKHILNAVKKTLGVWNYQSKNNKHIRCLCSSCLKDYMQTNAYIITRFDRFQTEKEICDRCNRLGWDYVIVPKTKGKSFQV